MDAIFPEPCFGVALQVHSIVNFIVNYLSYSCSSVISFIYLLFLSHFITLCFLETYLGPPQSAFSVDSLLLICASAELACHIQYMYSIHKFPCFACVSSVFQIFWEWAINQIAYLFFYGILSLLQVASMHSICSQHLQPIFLLTNIPSEVWTALKLHSLVVFGCHFNILDSVMF